MTERLITILCIADLIATLYYHLHSKLRIYFQYNAKKYKMDYSLKMLIFAAIFCLVNAQGRSMKRKHIVYWDPDMTPDLTKNDYSLDVEIGQFMDILCPQTSLGMTEKPRKAKALMFNIYNVTEDGYKRCDKDAGGKLIFACDRPERENKLTIKFQEISPSPFGFRFQYCQDYYFIAVPRDSSTGRMAHRKGCHGGSTKMKLKIGCKESKKVTTTTPKTTTTTTKKPITLSYLEKARLEALKNMDKKENSIIPTLRTVPTVKSVHVQPSPSKRIGNGASSTFSHIVVGILTILGLILQLKLTP